MLNNAEIFSLSLGYFGLEDPNHASPDLRLSIRTAFNAALQDIYKFGPEWLREQSMAFGVKAPQTVSGLSASQGSTTLTGGAFDASMVGCSVIFDAETTTNEIVSTNQLLKPVLGNYSNATATVFGDSILLPATFKSLAGNVWLDGKTWELTPFFYRAGQLYKNFPERPIQSVLVHAAVLDRYRIGWPEGYWIENVHNRSGSFLQKRFRVWPMPQEPHVIEFDAELNPESVVDADLTSTGYLTVPNSDHETILLPLILLNLANNPHFLEAKRANLETRELVLSRLKQDNPQRQTGATLRSQYSLPH